VERSLFSFGKTWAPVAIWMMLIFIFSTDWFAAPNTSSFFTPLLSWLIPGAAPEFIQIIHTALRKLGHWSEYFILANLLGRACQRQWPKQTRQGRFTTSVIIATLYAITDEWHQSFVPNRSASAIDVTIDASGAICGTIWTLYRERNFACRDIAQQVAKKT